MEELYLGWLEQLSRGLERWNNVRVDVKPRCIVVSGMGGSGIIGDYVKTLALNRSKIPVFTVKSHFLPAFVNENDIVFVVSYSGNTIETIRTYKEALARKANVVVITSNGYLLKDSIERKIPVVKVMEGLAPRTALPEMLYGVLGVLDTSGISIVTRTEAENAYEFLKEEIKHAIDESHKVALFIHENKGRLVIATHTPLESLAIRGKNEFNENAKIPAKVEVMPEWAHNDIVGWENPYVDDWVVLSIMDKDDDIGARLVEFMEKEYAKRNYPIYRLVLKGKSLLEKLLYGSLVLGLASVKLARLRDIDPLKTESIARYKKFINELLEL